MPAKHRPSENQLALAGMELTAPLITTKPKKKRPGIAARTENLERRVTWLEAEIAFMNGQLEREEDGD